MLRRRKQGGGHRRHKSEIRAVEVRHLTSISVVSMQERMEGEMPTRGVGRRATPRSGLHLPGCSALLDIPSPPSVAARLPGSTACPGIRLTVHRSLEVLKMRLTVVRSVVVSSIILLLPRGGTASAGRRTPGAPGRTSGSRTRDISGRSRSTRRIRTSPVSRPSAIFGRRMPSGVGVRSGSLYPPTRTHRLRYAALEDSLADAVEELSEEEARAGGAG